MDFIGRRRSWSKSRGTLDFAAAAALPLTSITAWEAMFDRLDVAEAGSWERPARS